MKRGNKNQPKGQFHKAGERIIATVLKNIEDGKDDPQLGWPGCDKFFPPKS